MLLASYDQRLSHGSGILGLQFEGRQRRAETCRNDQKTWNIWKKEQILLLIVKIDVLPTQGLQRYSKRTLAMKSFYSCLCSHQHFLLLVFPCFVFLCRLKPSQLKQKPSELHFPSQGMYMSMMLLALLTGPTGTKSHV